MSIDKEFVMALEDQRFAAMLANDADALAPWLDDEVIYIHSSAVKDSKAAYLDSLRTGHLAYHRFDRHYDQISSLGDDSFLVAGRIGISITLGGKPFELDNLFVAVWIKRDGNWRLISWQSTPVPRKDH